MNNLIINTKYTIKIIKHQDIIYIKADGNYSIIHKADGKTQMTCMRLSELERELCSKNFARPHKSFIVNCTYIIEINKKDKTILLENKVLAPVSTKRMSFKALEQLVRNPN